MCAKITTDSALITSNLYRIDNYRSWKKMYIYNETDNHMIKTRHDSHIVKILPIDGVGSYWTIFRGRIYYHCGNTEEAWIACVNLETLEVEAMRLMNFALVSE